MDQIIPAEMAPDPNDITRQVRRLARAIDRLPPGDYVIRLEKGDRQETWKALIEIEERQVVREMRLKK